MYPCCIQLNVVKADFRFYLNSALIPRKENVFYRKYKINYPQVPSISRSLTETLVFTHRSISLHT